MDELEQREGAGTDDARAVQRAASRRDPRRLEGLDEFRRLSGGPGGAALEHLSRHARLLLRAEAAVCVVRGAEGIEWLAPVHCHPPPQLRETETFADAALLASGPLLHDDVIGIAEEWRDVAALGWRAVASVPILVDGVTVAAVLVGRASGVPWGEREREAVRHWTTLLALQHARRSAHDARGDAIWDEAITHSALPMALLDARGTVATANAAFAEWLDEAPARVVGLPIIERLHTDVLERAVLGEVLDGKRRHASADVSWAHPDGLPRRARVQLAQARSPLDGARAFVLALEDVTELRGAAEALRAREAQLRLSQRREALGQLTGGLAHEFSNTLAAIIGFASLLRDDLEPTDPRRDDVEDILRVSGRATELINRLLDLSPQRVSERATFDLREVLRAFSVVAHRVLPTTIEWQLELPDDDVQAVVDRAQLEQVLLGLVLNSRDAMPKGGQIQVALTTTLLDRGDGASVPMACIRVADTGEGIPASVLPHLWTPFFTTKPLGTGLGLSVAQAILREHGGELKLESPAGVSAVFGAYLPLAPRAPRVARPADPKVIPLRAEPTGITVLLVEDERAVRSTTVRILERAGFRVVPASDGEEAWRLLEEHPDAYDVLVTDLIMPRLSGAELVRRLRQRTPDFPIVVTSAHPSRDWDAREIRADSVAVLKKPFGAGTLVETLRTVLASHGRELP